MAEADLLDEIDNLRDQIQSQQEEFNAMKDAKDLEIGRLEDKMGRVKDEVDRDWKEKMKNVDLDYREKMAKVASELDRLRAAFGGDTGGWEEREAKNGQVYYENTETGETKEDEPEALYIGRAMKKCEEADAMLEEHKALKEKFKSLELKKREADLLVNKTRTEMNSLRQMDRLWKDAAKAVFINLSDVKNIFDNQTDQIIGGLTAAKNAGERMKNVMPAFSVTKQYIADMQKKVKNQEATIVDLTNRIKGLNATIDECQAKIKRLSAGLEEEVERLTRPMRDKLSDCMVQIMRERAARAQERREMAAFWPEATLMPTSLMKYRPLSVDEKRRRIEQYHLYNANKALALEIRANVKESRSWELKYDDYGRAFYEHKNTGQTLWEEPEIMKYQPPEGRDEMGNVIDIPEEEAKNWQLKADNKGEIFYVNIETGEKTYISPFAYPKLPKGKPTKAIVSDAAKMVINFLKSKIKKHINQMKKIKDEKLNLLNPEERVKKLKDDKNKAQFNKAAEAAGESKEPEDPFEEDDPKEDLSQYRFDIETVENLAYMNDDDTKRQKDQDPSLLADARRDFLKDAEVRNFDVGAYSGPLLYELNIDELTVDQIRAIVEHISICEEKLENRLKKTRENLKDFTFCLMERIREYDIAMKEKKKQDYEALMEKKKDQLLDDKKMARKKLRKQMLAEAEAAREEELGQDLQDDNSTIVTQEGMGEGLGIGVGDDNKSVADPGVGVAGGDSNETQSVVQLPSLTAGQSPQGGQPSQSGNSNNATGDGAANAGGDAEIAVIEQGVKEGENAEASLSTLNDDDEIREIIENRVPLEMIRRKGEGSVEGSGTSSKKKLGDAAISGEAVIGGAEGKEEGGVVKAPEEKGKRHETAPTPLDAEMQNIAVAEEKEKKKKKKKEKEVIWQVGDIVEVNFHGRGKWYGGTVIRVHEDEEGAEPKPDAPPAVTGGGEVNPNPNPNPDPTAATTAIVASAPNPSPDLVVVPAVTDVSAPAEEKKEEKKGGMFGGFGGFGGLGASLTGALGGIGNLLGDIVGGKPKAAAPAFTVAVEAPKEAKKEKKPIIRTYDITYDAGQPIELTEEDLRELDGDDELLNLKDSGSVISEITTQGMEGFEDGFDPSLYLLGEPEIFPTDLSYSDEIVKITTKLVNYSLFCGYTNMRDVNYPENTHEFVFPENSKAVDDKWLTASFYINISQERLDAMRNAMTRMYDPTMGLLNSTPLDTMNLLQETFFDLQNSKRNPEKQKLASHTKLDGPLKVGSGYEVDNNRNQETPWLDSVQDIEQSLKINQELWKSRQFMCEVFRFQLQRDALTKAYEGRLVDKYRMDDMKSNNQDVDGTASLMGSVDSSAAPSPMQRPCLIAFRKVVSSGVSTKLWFDQQFQFIKLTFGRWSKTTSAQMSTGSDLVWDEDTLNLRLIVPIEKFHKDDLVIEVFDKNESVKDTLLGRGRTTITNNIAYNMGLDITYVIELKNRQGFPAGSVTVILKADDNLRAVTEQEYPTDDPNELGNLEFSEGKFRFKRYGTLETSKNQNVPGEEDVLSGLYPSLASQTDKFAAIADDLRGDGDGLMRMLVSDINIDEVLEKGHRLDRSSVQKLPDFKMTKAFLRRRTSYHYREREKNTSEIIRICEEIQVSIEEKFDDSQKQYATAKSIYSKILAEQATSQAEVDRITSNLDEIRYPAKKPDEPTFPPFEEPPYVLRLPASGALDSKGKKKKAFTTKQVKEFVADINSGRMDAGKEWVFGDLWPSSQQATQLNNEITARNAYHDKVRAGEIAEREGILEKYRIAMDQWEVDEKIRKKGCEKIRKELRKANLKLYCVVERKNRVQKEYDAIEMDADSFKEMKLIHDRSQDRFKMIRYKQRLESERQERYLNDLKRTLLRFIDARKRALDMPNGAINRSQFDEMVRKADECLRTIRVEIFLCKQNLYNEGVRLRQLHRDEMLTCVHELNRIRMFRDCIMQKTAIDKIVKRHRYECLHLFGSMEKLRLIEADQDEIGRGTVDNLGEIYSPAKSWDSQEIHRCQELIDLVMKKIELIECVNITSANSQKSLLECISTKWGHDFTPIRDCWTENSDYVRAEQLVHDIVQWTGLQQRKIADRERDALAENNELRFQVNAAQQQSDVQLTTHHYESKRMTSSAADVVKNLQNQLDVMRESTKANTERLERNIVDLSRECQRVRELLIANSLAYEDKNKVILAIVNTLQTSLQHMTGKMEVLMEERDKIIITAKLETDKLRSQLRNERKHCANLLFIVHSQTGTIKYYHDCLDIVQKASKKKEEQQKRDKNELRTQIWEQLFSFTRLCTDVDALFEFFVARVANLSGARKSLNEQLARNGANVVLAALCKSPRPLIRKLAARALGGFGWDGHVETRVLLWDCVLYWKVFKASVLKKDRTSYDKGLKVFMETGDYEALLNVEGKIDDFVAPASASLRAIIKQRRQWALRATKRKEGPNFANQKLINIKDGVIGALLDLCEKDGPVDREIPRNAALAISMASYDQSNHHDMTNDQRCIKILLDMCTKNDDIEVKTHAAVTIANLSHRDEHAQNIFGNSGAIEALLKMVSNTIVVDVLEAATAALANLTCYCDPNCNRVMEADGVRIMINLINNAYSENLLDADQNDEVQANSSEILANISRYNTENTYKYFDDQVILTLVFMCASKNKQVKRHAPLVVGNVAQSEKCRESFGLKGGIESLFLVLEDEDPVVRANTLWALTNLMWHPPNQERAGRFMSEIIGHIKSPPGPVRTYACMLMANVLYYNNSNRVRILESPGAMELLLETIVEGTDRAVMEANLRSIMSLSYIDHVSNYLGNVKQGNYIPLFLSLMKPPFTSRDIMRYSLEIMSNLCVHHDNRQAILDADGIAVLVHLHSDHDKYIEKLSVDVLGYLEDVTPPEVVARMKKEIGLDRMIVLVKNEDPIVRAVAVESIGEEVWHDPKKQKVATDSNSIELLLDLVNKVSEHVDAVLPAMWSLRNLMHNNYDGQQRFHEFEGVTKLVSLLNRTINGQFEEHAEKMLEACLACIATAIINHERISRKMLLIGLDLLVELAEMKIADMQGIDPYVRRACRSESVVALSKSILLMLGPYNYVVCRNCHKKQDMKGTTCLYCGSRLRIEVTEKFRIAPIKKDADKEPRIESSREGSPPKSAGAQRSRSANQGKRSTDGDIDMSKSMSSLPSINIVSSSIPNNSDEDKDAKIGGGSKKKGGGGTRASAGAGKEKLDDMDEEVKAAFDSQPI